MPEAQIIAGLSTRMDRYYALSVGVDKEGGIGITEVYDYPTHGEMEGREYTYHLQISAAYAHPFLALLALEGHHKLPPIHTDQRRWLVALFKRLVKKGVLAGVETATARRNLETLIWQEQIPNAKSIWSF